MGIWWYFMLMFLLVHQLMASKDRLVVNTTCLELAKQSNQRFRLSCDKPGYYHCLLDENYTREFEVCREWKWIPEGDCAYFNSFGEGNIDRRECTQNITRTCSPEQYQSHENSKYTACYEKKHTDTDGHTEITSSSQVTGTSDRENSTSSPGKSEETSFVVMEVLVIVLGIIVPVLSLCVIYFVCRHRKSFRNKKDPESDSKDAQTPNEDTKSPEQEPLMSNKITDKLSHKSDANNVSKCEKEEEEEQYEDAGLAYPHTCSSPSIIRKGSKGNLNDEERAQGDELKKEENKSSGNTSEHTEKSENVHLDHESLKESEERDTEAPDNANDAESTEVFDDSVESLQTSEGTTDEKEMELCQKLYGLLYNEGRELTEGVLRLVITRTVGKTPEELIAGETTKRNLKTILPEDSLRLLSNQTENVTSISVLYCLIQLYPGIEPQSGWGEPVNGRDTAIGDDVERLYRIFKICKDISNPVTITVDDYVRLLNIMLSAVTRLDSDGELKDNCKVLADKLEAIIDPYWSQSMFKMFQSFIKRWSPM